ncbi:MAG: ATP-binding cassette domain-containing protein, partial [Rectinemataceae bacterium]
RIGLGLRVRIQKAIEGLDYGLWKREKPSLWVSLFGRDIAAIESFFANTLPTLCFSILYLVFAIVALLITKVELGLLVLVGLPLAWLGQRLFGTRSFSRGEAYLREDGQAAAALEESFRSLPLAKVGRLGPGEASAFSARLSRLADTGRSFFFMSNLNRRAPNLSVHFLQVALLLFGGWLVIQGQLQVGQLIAANLLFGNVVMAVLDFSLVMGPLVQAGLAYGRIGEKLAELTASREVASGADSGDREAEEGPDGDKVVSIRNMRFAWPGGKLVIDGLSLDLRRGTRTAIVGESGCGKSTLASIILGLYRPVSGSVWREPGLPGVVFQDNPIFDRSLRENILLGADPGPGDNHLLDAIENSGLRSWIEGLKDGLETEAGEAGGFLSGGQRQRLALARALVLRPSLLVLDEATSAMDPLTEAAVNEALRKLGAMLTILHITHRLAGIADYDRIVLIAGGKIVEAGTHAELLAIEKGRYAAMWQRQSGLIVSGGDSARITESSLGTFPLFAASAPATLTSLCSAFVSESADAGSTIIRQGTPGSRFYIVARGRVEVGIRGLPGQKDEVIVANLGDGDFFGEMSLLDAVLTAASVRAVEDCVLLALEKDVFLKILESDQALAERVRAEADRRKSQNATLR